MKKRPILTMTVTIIAAVFFLVHIPFQANAAGTATGDLQIKAKASLAVDAGTGQILYEQNAKQPLAIASVSKLMTIYIVDQQIKAHKLKWNSPVKIDSKLAELSTAAELTNVTLKLGHTYTVRSLVKAALVSSANAAAIALGNKVSGNQKNFALLMQKTAKKMGIKHSKFYNAAGLPNKLMGKLALSGVSSNAENEMSAEGVGMVATNLINSFPAVTKITSLKNFVFAGSQYEGHNSLLGTKTVGHNVNVTGLKTGTSDKAGACFVGSATYQGRKIITVILHARNTSPTDPARYVQTEKLMRGVVINNRPVRINKRSKVDGVEDILVENAKNQTVKIGTNQNRWLWLPSNQDLKVTGQFTNKAKKIEAPLSTDQVVAKAELKVNGQKFEYLNDQDAKISMTPVKKVKKANVFVLLFRALAKLF